MLVSIKESHWNGVLDLPEGYRQTSSLRDTGERAMDLSNVAFILSELRALDDAKEGKCGDRYEYTFEIIEEGDWYFHNDTIIYKCPLDNEAYKIALRNGCCGYEWVQGWTFDANGDEVACDDVDRRVCPVLDLLIDIKHQLNNYPVLDDEDYDKRCLEARIEMVKDAAPSNVKLTDTQAERIVWALDQCSWPADDPNESGIAAKYQVEWSGDGSQGDAYHVYGNSMRPWNPNGPNEYIDLEACVKHAISVLHVRFYRRRKVG